MTSPEELAATLTTRWNQRDPEAIIALFSPTRRALAATHGAMIAERLGVSTIASTSLARVCSGRGPNFVLLTLDLTPRDTPSARDTTHEELWLTREDGSW